MASQSSFYASSPVVALPPSHPDQYFAKSHYVGANGIETNSFAPVGAIPPTPGSLAGRKRSRGDIHDLDDEEEQLDDGSVTTPPGQLAAQSAAWVENNTERKPFQLSHMKRPSISSRKSQRKDATAAAASDNLAQLVLPPQIREATQEPLIDEATRVLGISWTRMDATEATLISQAAYSKFIQNHYPGLKDVAIWFENSALPGYLVEAWNLYNGRKEYYIFANDLTEARLVTTEPAQLVPRLQMLPALHLAAPGGHIRAQAAPTPAAQNAINSIQAEVVDGGVGSSILLGGTDDDVQLDASSATPAESNGLCSAHEMELD